MPAPDRGVPPRGVPATAGRSDDFFSSLPFPLPLSFLRRDGVFSDTDSAFERLAVPVKLDAYRSERVTCRPRVAGGPPLLIHMPLSSRLTCTGCAPPIASFNAVTCSVSSPSASRSSPLSASRSSTSAMPFSTSVGSISSRPAAASHAESFDACERGVSAAAYADMRDVPGVVDSGLIARGSNSSIEPFFSSSSVVRTFFDLGRRAGLALARSSCRCSMVTSFSFLGTAFGGRPPIPGMPPPGGEPLISAFSLDLMSPPPPPASSSSSSGEVNLTCENLPGSGLYVFAAADTLSRTSSGSPNSFMSSAESVLRSSTRSTPNSRSVSAYVVGRSACSRKASRLDAMQLHG